jgi:hypothetical protein
MTVWEEKEREVPEMGMTCEWPQAERPAQAVWCNATSADGKVRLYVLRKLARLPFLAGVC